MLLISIEEGAFVRGDALVLLSRFRSNSRCVGVTKENIKRAVTGEGFVLGAVKREGMQ